MTELVQFIPLRYETVETIRARLDADANAGIAPTDDRFMDLTPGGWYYDLTNVIALEIERLYNFFSTELPASIFPSFSWGEYLDEWGVTLNMPRKPASQSTGLLYFEGDVGTRVPTGTTVGVPQLDPNALPILFATMEDISLAAIPAPVGLGATQVSSGGFLDAAITISGLGWWYYVVTAVTLEGETIASSEVAIQTVGHNSKVTLTWDPVADAIGYHVYRGVRASLNYHLMMLGTVTTYVDDGTAVLGLTRPPTNTADIQAVDVGEHANVPISSVTELLSPVVGVSAVLNPSATSGGADVETDEAFRVRLMIELGAPQGGGTIADYERWGLAYPAVGFVTVIPVWAGAGTVKLVLTDPDNNPVSSAVLSQVQNDLDPVAQKGEGLAPIGAGVTVDTPVSVPITVAGVLVLADGYSLDGFEGNIAVRLDVEDAIRAYINALPPGADVVIAHAEATVFAVDGVVDVTTFTLNGTTSNIAISSSQVALTADPISLS
jgi:uncharacterized phage protein gp47/JayE